MPHVSVPLYRLYLLRAMYLFVVVGLGFMVWPGVLHPNPNRELMDGVVAAMLAAFSMLCLVGLRYPLQMLPALMWELLWKVIWLAGVVYPHWRAGTLDEATTTNAYYCALVVLIPIVMPWRYVWDHYVRKAGDRWKVAVQG